MFNRENIQSIEQVFPELVLPNHRWQVAMGRRDDPHIDLDRPCAAQAFELLFLHRAQQFRLQFQADVADLIQKQRAMVSEFESALFLDERPSKRSLLVPEHFAFQQSRGNSGAVHAS